jgi:hypothetical protein
MYIVSYLKQGLGNKIYIFANIVYFYLELKARHPEFTKLYIAEAVSKHQKDVRGEKFKRLFPNISEYKWIEFISNQRMDELKKGAMKVSQDSLDFSKLNKSMITKNIYFEPNYNLSKVPFDKYFNLFSDMLSANGMGADDFINAGPEGLYNFKKDILMHMRYGDKLDYVLKGTHDFVVLRPKYYFDALEILGPLENEIRKVHIMTDSPALIEEVFMPEFKKLKDFEFIISDEPYWNVFHLATKFHNLIISDSTLVNSGINLNKVYKNVVAYAYVMEDKAKKEVSNWPNPEPIKFQYKDKTLVVNPLLEPDFITLTEKNYMIMNGKF